MVLRGQRLLRNGRPRPLPVDPLVAYMVFQQYTTAVLDAYAGHPDVADHLASARECRRWQQSLDIDPKVRVALVEQAQVLEAAFERLSG